ncbi:MAG: hypothetical protein LAO04_13650 [Acidobacteriia bacterium]|nr:hypothetical protein [Terriglobia bacterium]
MLPFSKERGRNANELMFVTVLFGRDGKYAAGERKRVPLRLRDSELERQTTRIDFSPIHLPETSTAFWLPTKVIVDVWRFHRHFRNIHQYSGFKLFRVESRIGPVPEK